MEITARSSSPIIELTDFTFAYPDGTPVLAHLDMQVERGAFALLVGPTGCGKTTLLTNLKPEIAPAGTRSGSALVIGEELYDAQGNVHLRAAAHVGFVAQSPDNQMVCDTVWHEPAFGLENAGIPQDEMRRRIAEIAHFFGIEPWMRRASSDLSNGQKQMVNLAAVLALRPAVLLLDEPTAQLDPVASRTFLHALFRINRELGITVLMATHAPESAADYATVCLALDEDGISQRDLATFKPQPWQAAWYALPSDTEHRPVTVEMKDGYVRYDRTEPWVLRGCDFDAHEGAISALVGGNGCGKSTLIRTVAGIMRCERGKLRNDGRAQQAYLPQNPEALFVCDTVAEELTEWQQRCGFSDQEVADIVEEAELTHVIDHHPFDLSGGQRQKLALAKLLLTHPRLLLLDEPTKGLDPLSKCTVARMLTKTANEGATIIIATHDLPFTACMAQSVSMLFDGQMACTQPAAEFFEDNLFYRASEDGFVRAWRERP